MNNAVNHILITGATGWAGQALVNALRYGIDEIPAFQKVSPNARIRLLITPHEKERVSGFKNHDLEVTFGDVRDRKAILEFYKGTNNALVFHLAGVIHPKRVRDFYEINYLGAKNLVEGALEACAYKFISMSSNSPFGCNQNGQVFDENSSFNPYLGYGKSKKMVEELVKSINPLNLRAVRIRSPWFYGPYQPDRQTTFYEMIKYGRVPIVGGGENLRSMTYINNLTYGLLLAARSDISNGKAYWIADKRPYRMNEIVDTIEQVMIDDFGIKCAKKRVRVPSIVSKVGYACDYGLQFMGLYNQKIHVLSEMNKNIACSVELARKDLGYDSPITLEIGVRKSIEWMIANNKMGKLK